MDISGAETLTVEEMLPPGALGQLGVPVQDIGGEAVEDERLGGHAVHRRVRSLRQSEGLHHVES